MTTTGLSLEVSQIGITHSSAKPDARTCSLGNKLRPSSSMDTSSTKPLKERNIEIKTSGVRTGKIASCISCTPYSSRVHPSSNISNVDLLREMGHKITQCSHSSESSTDVNWEAMTNRELNDFIKKASMFGTLIKMDANLSSALSSEIIREACETNRSICDLYMEKMKKAGKNLGLWGWLSAKFIYFIYYYCGIIPGIVHGVAKTLLQKMRFELILQDGGKNLNALVDKVLSRADAFLADYLKAVREYGEGKGKGSRDDYLSTQLQQPIDKICDEFGDTALRDLFPKHIPLFQSKILYPLEMCLSRWIKKELRKQIPSMTKSLVISSTEAAQQKNLPFAVSITRGILDQLKKFKTQVSKPSVSHADSPIEMAGTEKLPQVVSQLLDVLRFEPHKTREELRKNLDNTDSSKISAMITESLQTAIVDGCRVFFSYMTDAKNSEEFFYQLLSLSNAPFTDKAPSTPEEWHQLDNSYIELKKEMRREAGELFQTIIHQSVSNHIHGFSDSDIEQIADAYCQSQRDKLNSTTELLKSDLIKMRTTLNGPSTTEKNINNHLDSFLSTVDAYRTKAVIENTPQLSEAFKQGIDQTLKPAYLSLKTLVDEAVKMRERLQTNQELRTSMDQIEKNLEELKQTIPMIQPLRMEPMGNRLIRYLGGTTSLTVGAVTAALGFGLTYLIGPYAMPLLGGTAGTLYTWKNNPSSSMNSLFKGTLFGAAAGAAASFIPGGVTPYTAPAVLSGLAMGKRAQKAATSMFSDKYVFPKVMAIFDSMYNFLLQGHVWKWAVIDSVDMVNAAYRK